MVAMQAACPSRRPHYVTHIVVASPRVTIWIPSYNYGRYLPAAIDSVLAQDFTDFELLVFDDGSTDGSFEIGVDYASRDARVRVLTHPDRRNHGVSPTMIAAFEASKGELVGVLSADDMLFPRSLSRRVELLDADARLSFVYGLIEMVDEEGSRTGEIIGTPPEMLFSIDATDDVFAAMLLHNYIPGHAVLTRRQAFGRAGGLDERLLYSDWELSIKLLAQGRAGFLPYPPVAGHREHGESMSLAATRKDNLARKLDVFRATDEKMETIGGRLAEPRMRALVRLQRAWHAYAVDDLGDARSAVSGAFDTDPSLATAPAWILWWLGPRQTTGQPNCVARSIVEHLGDSAAVISDGAGNGHFGCWLIEEAGDRLSPDVRAQLAWGVISNALELSRDGFRIEVLAALSRRAVLEPRLLTERLFVKSIVCASGAWGGYLGVWKLARRARR